jgi:hypothetical protein
VDISYFFSGLTREGEAAAERRPTLVGVAANF